MIEKAFGGLIAPNNSIQFYLYWTKLQQHFPEGALYSKINPTILERTPNNHTTQAHSNSGKEKFLFNRKKPHNEPRSGRGSHLLRLVGGKRRGKKREQKETGQKIKCHISDFFFFNSWTLRLLCDSQLKIIILCLILLPSTVLKKLF